MERFQSCITPRQIPFVRMTVDIVTAYVAHNVVPAQALPGLIESTANALVSLEVSGPSEAPTAVQLTQTEIRRSITHEALISFEDGRRYKTLKRHLKAHGLTPETYRAKWALPRDYPMVASGYSARRSAIAVGLQSRHVNRAADLLIQVAD